MIMRGHRDDSYRRPAEQEQTFIRMMFVNTGEKHLPMAGG